MGGMAAQIPIKSDEKANAEAMEKVRQDKLREVKAGHDGTWVAHPGLISIALEAFDKHMKGDNQIDRKIAKPNITQEDLCRVPEGEITEAGVRSNINVGILYLESWLRGNGCVPLYNLMEDAATAEISRSQIWQWVKHGAKTKEGVVITQEVILALMDQELGKIRELVGNERFDSGLFHQAVDLFKQMTSAEQYPDFLTLPAYEILEG